MKKLTFVLAILVSVAVVGCKKKDGGGSDCASLGGAVDRMMEAEKAKGGDMPPEAKKMAEEMMKTMVPKMKSAMIKACNDDKWSADAIKCMTGAKNEAEMKACDGKLTPAQKTNVEKAMMEAMGMGGMGGDMKKDEPPPPPTEGSGSAAAEPTEGSEGSAAPAGSGG